MVEQSIDTVVSTYLNALIEKGIPVRYGVIYGSQVTGHAHQWSDIELLVISPHFDKNTRVRM
jgi:predicted nucleotidyltransferase